MFDWIYDHNANCEWWEAKDKDRTWTILKPFDSIKYNIYTKNSTFEIRTALTLEWAEKAVIQWNHELKQVLKNGS